MSIACTRINDEPLGTSLLGDKKEEPNSFNRIFSKIDGASFNQIRNETHIVAPTVLENWTNVTAASHNQVFHIGNLRNSDETYAACTQSETELSHSAVTKSKELLKHPVFEQLEKIGARSAIAK